MTVDKATVKVFFGALIFMFSLALAYFTATYLDSSKVLDYWPALAGFAGVYLVVGIAVYMVFPVSLGFLFSADVLILHLMIENFGDISSIAKAMIIGVILVMLYAFAWVQMGDEPSAGGLPPAPTPPPQVPPIVPNFPAQ